jgi:type I restriction enzyme, R subunit
MLELALRRYQNRAIEAAQVLEELIGLARDIRKASARGEELHLWTVRENVRAQLRVLVKRILRKYGYPPDKQEKATQTVLEQAEVLSQDWVTV